MGMYDTFWGTYTCRHCGKEVGFEEQTKDFDNCLFDFKLGDYIDRGNRNYFYYFAYECPECHGETELSIGIRNGQYVGVFLAEEAKTLDPKELDNIEDGLQRRLEYDKKCEEKLGYEEAKGTYDELIALKPGDTIEALRTTWRVLEAYYEKIAEDKLSFLHHPTMVYRVEADGINRVITASINPFTQKMYYHVCEDDLTPLSFKERLEIGNENRCYIDEDGELLMMQDGGLVWNQEDGRKVVVYQTLIRRGILSDADDGDDAVAGDFNEEYIKSPEVKKLMEKESFTFLDSDKATIIYNSGACLRKKYKELKKLANETSDEKLKKQIMERIDHDANALRQFDQYGGGFVFQLLVKEDGDLQGYGFFRDAKFAIEKGKETGKEFRVEKHQIFHEGTPILKNRAIATPLLELDPNKRVDEFYAPGSPIAALDYDCSKRLIHFFSDELPIEDELKVSGYGKERFEGAYVVIPNPYEKGDKVRIIGTDIVGTVSVSQEEWKKYVEKALKSGAVDDWVDASITIVYSDGNHDHVNPIYLEKVEDGG
ncbi:MAG: hypothetical protein E7301_00135 [Butyrivibrio sp.]|nr:hypothetical protein [Butyrivibrio sp.]